MFVCASAVDSLGPATANARVSKCVTEVETTRWPRSLCLLPTAVTGRQRSAIYDSTIPCSALYVPASCCRQLIVQHRLQPVELIAWNSGQQTARTSSSLISSSLDWNRCIICQTLTDKNLQCPTESRRCTDGRAEYISFLLGVYTCSNQLQSVNGLERGCTTGLRVGCFRLQQLILFNSCNRQQPTRNNENALATRLYNRLHNRAVSMTNHSRPMRDVTPTSYSASQHGFREVVVRS